MRAVAWTTLMLFFGIPLAILGLYVWRKKAAKDALTVATNAAAVGPASLPDTKLDTSSAGPSIKQRLATRTTLRGIDSSLPATSYSPIVDMSEPAPSPAFATILATNPGQFGGLDEFGFRTVLPADNLLTADLVPVMGGISPIQGDALLRALAMDEIRRGMPDMNFIRWNRNHPDQPLSPTMA